MIQFGFHPVSLETLSQDNLGLYRRWRNTPSIYRWCRQEDLITENGHSDWYDSLDSRTRMYEIHSNNQDCPDGVCGLTSINKIHNHAEFSLYISKESQNRGLSTPSLQTLFSHGFLNLGLNVIWGETLEGNRAAKVFEKMGMVLEGTRREYYYKQGRYWDCCIYSITRKEFEGLEWGKKAITYTSY